MNDKQSDVMAILKLYELRRETEMRRARPWYLARWTVKTGSRQNQRAENAALAV